MVLKVNYKKGPIVEKDVSCNSKFMLENIWGIGKDIRAAYSFIDADVNVYLCMDNVGGGDGKT